MQLSNNTSVTFTLAHSCCINSHKLLVVYVPVACSLSWRREEEWGSNFLVCVWNPVLRPFKQYFFKAAYARCYLISVLLVRKRNEWILIRGTHANERSRVWAPYFENAVWICDKQQGHTLNYRDGPSEKLWRFFFFCQCWIFFRTTPRVRFFHSISPGTKNFAPQPPITFLMVCPLPYMSKLPFNNFFFIIFSLTSLFLVRESTTVARVFVLTFCMNKRVYHCQLIQVNFI